MSLGLCTRATKSLSGIPSSSKTYHSGSCDGAGTTDWKAGRIWVRRDTLYAKALIHALPVVARLNLESYGTAETRIMNLQLAFFAPLILMMAFVAMSAEVFTTKPTIVRAVGPVRPGETVLLLGDWPANASVEAAQLTADTDRSSLVWEKLDPLQASETAMKCTIPSAWPMGAYACRILAGGLQPSEPVMLNLADPWWLLGDGGATATSPGGWLRIFGSGLHFDGASRVQFEGPARKMSVVAEASKDEAGHALHIAVPTDLPDGTYSVAVHNGFGGSDGWIPAGHVQIRPRPARSSEIFDVSTFGSVADDATACVKAALTKASSNGGGIVYFPRGRYRINETLDVAAHTTLKGEGEGLVSLYWPAREKPLDSLIHGTDDFAVEDLALYTHGVHKNVISGRDNVRVQRVRIRTNFYFRHDFVGKPTGSLDDGLRISPVVEPTHKAGQAVFITGDNPVVTDCDIYHSRFGFVLQHTDGGVIARNQLDCGQGGFQTYCISRVVIEENEIAGSSPWASGNAISLYHGCAAYHVYFAHNRVRQVYGGDREALTTDGHGTAYFGRVAGVHGTQITLQDASWWGNTHKDMITAESFRKTIVSNRPTGDFAGDEWHGVTLYVLSGRGAGQHRNVIECSDRAVTIEMPFAVSPDAHSIVSIGKFQGRHLVIGNEFRDCKQSVQLYAPCCDSIVAKNQSWRTDCMNSGAMIMRVNEGQWRVEPGWFNQFLDNRVWEGNGWAGNAMVLDIVGHLKVSTKDPAIRAVRPSIGHVVRGNQLDNNAFIRVDGDVGDVIIEHNDVSHADQGIVVTSQTTTADSSGVWIGDNTFHNIANPAVSPR